MQDQVTDVVQPGMAVCQKYGFGTAWLHKFDQKKICPGGLSSPCATISARDGGLYVSP